MAVYVLDQYQTNSKSLAEYLANTVNEFHIIKGTTSNVGYREGKETSSIYHTKIVDILCNPIRPTVDCFVNTDKSIVAKVYIPEFAYIVSALDEKSSRPVRLGCCSKPTAFTHAFPAKNIKNYDDFKEAMDTLISNIKVEIEKKIKKLETADFEFKDIDFSVDFNVYSTNTI